MSENYDKMRRPPQTALRQIQAGDLKGKTDINPQWRYEIMDTVFGPCGIGWKYELVKLWSHDCADGTVLAFAQVNVYVKQGDAWSEPIPGIGGNTLVDMVKGYSQGDPKRAKPNDEGFKMATTDALSVALKMLGVAADVYMGKWDGSKYRDNPADDEGSSSRPDTSELVKVKTDLIDWLNTTPPVFNDEWTKYANKCIEVGDLKGMKTCIETAKKIAKGVK